MEIEGAGEGAKPWTRFADLPEEIVFAILKRVPATSLLRLKCVCKRWNSVIDDDDFVAAHHEIAMTADPGFMFSHYDYDLDLRPNFYSCCVSGGPYYETRTLTMNQIMERAGGGGGGGWHAGFTLTKLPLLQRWRTPSTFLFSTCRGLALFARESENKEAFEINFFVFNPVTGEEVELPRLLLPPAQPRPLLNEVTAESNYVLGFDGRSGVYKVLVLDSRRTPVLFAANNTQCFVHTVGRDQCWRPVHLETPRYVWRTFYCCGAALDGCLHWMAEDTHWDAERKGKILSFDMHDEVFFYSYHAELVNKGARDLKVIGQSVAAAIHRCGIYDPQKRIVQCFDICVLDDETATTPWSTQSPLEIIFPNTYKDVWIEGSSGDNHLMAIYEDYDYMRGVLAYNVETGECMNFHHMPGYVVILPHHPSLVSPKKLSALQNTKYLKLEEKSKAWGRTIEPPSRQPIEEGWLSFDIDLSALFG